MSIVVIMSSFTDIRRINYTIKNLKRKSIDFQNNRNIMKGLGDLFNGAENKYEY